MQTYGTNCISKNMFYIIHALNVAHIRITTTKLLAASFSFFQERARREHDRGDTITKKCFPKQKCCSWNKTIKKEFLIQKNCLNQKYY
jgi:hypothetical protein